MFDFLIIDKLFQFLFDLLRMAQSENSNNGETFGLLKSVMGLAAQTSLKASQCINAAFVANRVALREMVLDKFDAHEYSRETLRGSSFASKDLFGPLPDSLKDKLSAQNGERFMFTPKPTQPSQASKRQASGSSSAPKRKKVVATPAVHYAPQRPQPMSAPSTSGTNFRRQQGRSRGRGFRKRRGGYS